MKTKEEERYKNLSAEKIKKDRKIERKKWGEEEARIYYEKAGRSIEY